MIAVEVRLYATLRKYHPDSGIGEPISVQMEDNTTLGDLFGILMIPREEIKAVFVNGKWQEDSHFLGDGDRIGIFPPIGGG